MRHFGLLHESDANVVDAMLKAGFTPDEIGRIGGGNYLRLLGEATKR